MLFLVFRSLAQAQKLSGRARLDSLRAAVETMPEDTNKVDALSSLSFGYREFDPDSGVHYGLQSLSLANTFNDKVRVGNAYRRIGSNYYVLTDYPKAIEHILLALQHFEAKKYLRGIYSANKQLGMVYLSLQDLPAARKYFTAGFHAAEQENDTLLLGDATLELGNINLEEGKYQEAIAEYRKAESLYTAVSDDNSLALVAGNIATVYLLQNKYEQALPSLHQAFDRAMHSHLTENSANFARSLAIAYYHLATDSAAIILSDSLSDKTELLRKAEQYTRLSTQMYESLRSLGNLSSTYDMLAQILEHRGLSAEALSFYRKSVALKDSVFSQDNRDKIEQLTKQREEDLKQSQIDLQKVEIAKAKQQRLFYVIGLVGLLVIVALVTLFLFNTRKAKRLSDRLLHNILPVHTAKELKMHGHAKPRRYENVTVLFTDFKDFAKLAEGLSAEETVSLIHHYFTQFDRIVKKHGLEKIKTIGDAYMAAAGVPVEDSNHAANAVNAAVAIRDFVTKEMAERRANDQPYFDIRIGVHSGSVVAGIVGESKFAYDIWGNTVNLAARMESSGEPGKVNISGATYKLIKDEFVCHQRGAIEIKHGGLVEMYFVESEERESVVA